MIRLLCSVVIFFIILVGCSKEKEQQPQISAETQRRVDSLQAYNDSIARDKELHYQFQGTHSHLNAKGKLSEHAHQNLPKKRRLAKLRRETRPSRQEAYRKSKERQQQRIAEHKRRIGKSDSSQEIMDTTPPKVTPIP